MMEVLSEDGATPTLGRFMLFEISSLAALQDLPPTSRHFALLTLFDFSQTDETEMTDTAEVLVPRGLAYACCWGKHCKLWHDSIDTAYVESTLDDEPDSCEVLMTTWHTGEPIEEALHFFGRLATPTPKFAEDCWDYVIAAAPEYVETVRAVFHGR